MPVDDTAEPAEVPVTARQAAPRRRRSPRIHVPNGEATQSEEPAAAIDEVTVAAPEEVVDETPSEEGGDTGEEGAPAKKRTRRGSRGGRNRRKKPVGANGDGTPEEADVDGGDAIAAGSDGSPPDPAEAPGREAQPVPGGADPVDEEEAYVPMSEWIEDFDRRP